MSGTKSPNGVSRRAFLTATAGSAAMFAAGSLGGFATATALAGKPVGGGTRNPPYIPPTTSPTSLTLTEAPGVVDLGGGKLSKAWAYNGGLPGPTLVARKGDTATITLKNDLPSEPTITHWHGMLVDHKNDGHPMEAIGPGGIYAYSFPILNRAALNWYHPHPHMLTGEQVAIGLAGGLIIRARVGGTLPLPG